MNFAREIISWYLINKRDLPWRNTRDPYIIWLSEIIMQQTRVEQGTPYFHRFAENYPTVADFASASEEEILKHWQGLGYYSRGRNMHYTARMVMEEHNGYFPKKYDELLKLKGVGEYTAAAIASFAADEAKAVVDGNVFRLLSRYFGIDTPINSSRGKTEFTELANQVMDKTQAGIYNQASMEFGSLQCRPVKPDCSQCPLRIDCYACKHDKVQELPVKIKAAAVRNRYFNYIIIENESSVLMHQRTGKDIWKNMYEFPLIETAEALSAAELLASAGFKSLFGENVVLKGVFGPVKHLLSHQRLHTQFLIIGQSEALFKGQKPWFYAEKGLLSSLPMPKLIFEFIKKFF